MEEATKTTYVRRLSLFDGVMVVIGGIVGAGIFLNPAIVAQRAVTASLTLAAWVLGGVIAVAGALCFAELGARRPEAGGGYIYLRDTMGGLPAFLYGWTQLLVINTGGIAAVAITFARYASALAHAPVAWVKPLGIGAIVLLSAVNYFGVRPGATTQNIATLLKLVALAALIGAALLLSPHSGPTAVEASVAGTPPRGAGAVVGVLGASLIPVLFSYGGWQHANHIGGEIRDPLRNLPRAIIIGVIVVVAVYVLANVAYLRVLGPTGLAASLAPADDTMRDVLGPAGATFITAGIVISTFGITNLFIMAAPRVYQAMADDGLFFRSAARLHPRWRTPAGAIAFQAAWAVLLALSGTYGQLLDWVVFGDWIFFGLVAATLFRYRRADGAGAGLRRGAGRGFAGAPGAELRFASAPGARAAHAERPADGGGFRLPGYPFVPVFFVLTAVFVVGSSVASNPRNAALGALLIGAGIPVFLYWRRGSRGGGEIPG